MGHFTASYSGLYHHTTMLFNRQITNKVCGMKFCLVTYIPLKLFSKVIIGDNPGEFDENLSTIQIILTIYIVSLVFP